MKRHAPEHGGRNREVRRRPREKPKGGLCEQKRSEAGAKKRRGRKRNEGRRGKALKKVLRVSCKCPSRNYRDLELPSQLFVFPALVPNALKQSGAAKERNHDQCCSSIKSAICCGLGPKVVYSHSLRRPASDGGKITRWTKMEQSREAA